MNRKKPRKAQPAASIQPEKGHLFSKKNKVSVWASQIPYEDIPDSYFEERFFKNNTRACNRWTDNYQMRYFRPSELETNGVTEGLGDVRAIAGACSFSDSFILPLMSKAKKKQLTQVSWLILLYEYEYSVKISGIEADDTTVFLGAFDYKDDAETLIEADKKRAMAAVTAEPLPTLAPSASTSFGFSKRAGSAKKQEKPQYVPEDSPPTTVQGSAKPKDKAKPAVKRPQTEKAAQSEPKKPRGEQRDRTEVTRTQQHKADQPQAKASSLSKITQPEVTPTEAEQSVSAATKPNKPKASTRFSFSKK